jgi:tetratricopeptide (TPR) repeat protein
LTLALLLGAALAADPPPADDESLTGIEVSKPVADVPVVGPPIPAELAGKSSAERGAEQLHLDLGFVTGIQGGLEKLYRRDYAGTKTYFLQLELEYPNTAVAEVVDTLIWQAMMLENFDFRYDSQYWVASKTARAALDRALAAPGNEAWEHFLYGGIVGLESIHTARTGSYQSALQLAFEALDHIQKTRELAPTFTDLLLADGMYNYWRTVITESSSLLPDFGDKRAEGIAQMRQVEEGGIFLGPATTLALAFTWIEAGKYTDALASCQKNRAVYPHNVINNLLQGMTYTSLRKYPDAIHLFDEVLADAPENHRAHYLKGLALLRAARYADAETELTTYIASDYLEKWELSGAHWRLGQTYEKQQKWSGADAEFTASVKLDGNPQAKSALEALRTRRKKGEITY